MSENIIAVSVSDGPDLQVFGFLPQHLRRLLAFLSGAILCEDWRVGYGGDLRRDGFTRSLLADMAAAYARGDIAGEGQAPIVHFFAFSSWRDMSPDAILNHLMDKDLAPGDAPIAPVLETRFFLPAQRQVAGRDGAGPSYVAVVVEDAKLRAPGGGPQIEAGDLLCQLQDAAKSRSEAGVELTAMRRAMGLACPLRIQFSGRVAGYSGDRPGILEEAIEQIAAGGLVLPLAAFGGATREVAIALKLFDAPRVRYPEYGRNYEDAFGALQALAGRHRERAGPLWDHLAAAAALSEPHRIAFQLKEILPALAPAARALER